MEKNRLEEKLLAVPGSGQVRKASNIWVTGTTTGSPRILFLGNSVTYHPPSADIGWYGDWGMAASARENDYVHLVMSAIKEAYPEAAFCMAQGSVWETTLENCDYEEAFGAAKEFEADIILCSLEANIPEDTFDGTIFQREMERLQQYLGRPDGSTRLIMASSICRIPKKDAAIEAYAKAHHARYQYIGDIFEKEENLAIGRFSHVGVAHHPGDAGMRCLAGRYIDILREILNRAAEDD